jgi:hypothetical protein
MVCKVSVLTNYIVKPSTLNQTIGLYHELVSIQEEEEEEAVAPTAV